MRGDDRGGLFLLSLPVFQCTPKVPSGSTDCALPVAWATEGGRAADVFVVLTNNPLWPFSAGPAEALQKHRRVRTLPTPFGSRNPPHLTPPASPTENWGQVQAGDLWADLQRPHPGRHRRPGSAERLRLRRRSAECHLQPGPGPDLTGGGPQELVSPQTALIQKTPTVPDPPSPEMALFLMSRAFIVAGDTCWERSAEGLLRIIFQ